MRSIGKTDKGKKRSMNQDMFFISDTPVGILPNLYIVAAGGGGGEDGRGAGACGGGPGANAPQIAPEPSVEPSSTRISSKSA